MVRRYRDAQELRARAKAPAMLARAALHVVVLMPHAHGTGGNSEEMTDGPLAGFRILDLSSVISGPFCTMLLGDLGADIIKIEAPEGDTLRTFSRPQKNGMSAGFLSFNRSKRSIIIDLQKDG